MQINGDASALAKALILARGNMGDVVKHALAKGEKFSYTYADLATVLDSVTPALQSAGLVIVQGASAAYAEVPTVTIETLLLHESGASLTSELTLRPSKSDPQGIGSAITYGRRYAVMALCGVAPEDDDGARASGPSEPQRERTLHPANGVHPTPDADEVRAQLKARLHELYDDPRLTPTERDEAVFAVTGDSSIAHLASIGAARRVIASLEAALSKATTEVPF